MLNELRKKYARENNITLLALLPDEPTKIRHRKMTLMKNVNKCNKYVYPPELMNFRVADNYASKTAVSGNTSQPLPPIIENDTEISKNSVVAAVTDVPYIWNLFIMFI